MWQVSHKYAGSITQWFQVQAPETNSRGADPCSATHLAAAEDLARARLCAKHWGQSEEQNGPALATTLYKYTNRGRHTN